MPHLPEQAYKLPGLVGRLFDNTILPANALRRLANWWVRLSSSTLNAIGDVVRPLRYEAELRRTNTNGTPSAVPAPSGNMNTEVDGEDTDADDALDSDYE